MLLAMISPVHASEPEEVSSFTIEVDETVLSDLQQRIDHTRWPHQIEGQNWRYGVDSAWLRKLVDYWRNDYDWRKEEKKLNAFPQFQTEIDGLDLHFIHVKSKHANALPILLVHGWPGSFCEFTKIIPMLSDPEKYGGAPEDAFHVVVPSLPGFGFSEKPKDPGWNSVRMAEVFAKLMSRLGYEHYGAQGGDWGGGMVRWLASNDGAHCVGAHSNFPSAAAPRKDPMHNVTPEEMERFQARRTELGDHKGYASIQSTRPLALAYGLNDSPVGLAAWIVDKFWAWSDHGGKLENSFTKDELLTNIMIYWVTDSMPSSTRIYFETRHGSVRPATMTPFKVSGPPAPLGFALFPKEINVPPRAWVERSVGDAFLHWTEMPRGGHFAAMENPELLAEDVRTFFRKVKKRDREGAAILK